MKNIVIGMVVLVILAAAGFLVFNTGDSEQQTALDNATGAESSEPIQGDESTSLPSELREDTSNDSEQPGASPASAVVTYDNNGFTPNTVGPIAVGDTVEFRNESNQTLWVASNNHPTHTLYGEFDQGTSIANGESWSFTFTQAGTWGYHNHLNPGDTGSVQVLAE